MIAGKTEAQRFPLWTQYPRCCCPCLSFPGTSHACRGWSGGGEPLPQLCCGKAWLWASRLPRWVSARLGRGPLISEVCLPALLMGNCLHCQHHPGHSPSSPTNSGKQPQLQCSHHPITRVAGTINLGHTDAGKSAAIFMAITVHRTLRLRSFAFLMGSLACPLLQPHQSPSPCLLSFLTGSCLIPAPHPPSPLHPLPKHTHSTLPLSYHRQWGQDQKTV